MDQIFLTINSWMSQGLLPGGLGCFLWGMVSVLFSPCHLASNPLIIGYVEARINWSRDARQHSMPFFLPPACLSRSLSSGFSARCSAECLGMSGRIGPSSSACHLFDVWRFLMAHFYSMKIQKAHETLLKFYPIPLTSCCCAFWASRNLFLRMCNGTEEYRNDVSSRPSIAPDKITRSGQLYFRPNTISLIISL